MAARDEDVVFRVRSRPERENTTPCEVGCCLGWRSRMICVNDNGMDEGEEGIEAAPGTKLAREKQRRHQADWAGYLPRRNGGRFV